jgi:hypothetical protein
LKAEGDSAIDGATLLSTPTLRYPKLASILRVSPHSVRAQVGLLLVTLTAQLDPIT